MCGNHQNPLKNRLNRFLYQGTIYIRIKILAYVSLVKTDWNGICTLLSTNKLSILYSYLVSWQGIRRYIADLGVVLPNPQGRDNMTPWLALHPHILCQETKFNDCFTTPQSLFQAKDNWKVFVFLFLAPKHYMYGVINLPAWLHW